MPTPRPVPPCAPEAAPFRCGDVVQLKTSSAPFVVVEIFTAYRIRCADHFPPLHHEVRACELVSAAPGLTHAVPPLKIADLGAETDPVACAPPCQWVNVEAWRSRPHEFVAGDPTAGDLSDTCIACGRLCYEEPHPVLAGSATAPSVGVGEGPQMGDAPDSLHWLDGDSHTSRSKCGAYTIDFTGHYAVPYRATKTVAGGSRVVGNFASVHAAKDACQDDKTYPF